MIHSLHKDLQKSILMSQKLQQTNYDNGRDRVKRFPNKKRFQSLIQLMRFHLLKI